MQRIDLKHFIDGVVSNANISLSLQELSLYELSAVVYLAICLSGCNFLILCSNISLYQKYMDLGYYRGESLPC